MKAKGIVVDSDGKGVGGVRVFAVASWYAEWPDVTSEIKAEVVSGRDGSFEFESLPKPMPTWKYDFVAYEPDQYLGWTSGEGRLTYQGSWHYPEPEVYEILVSKPSIREGRVVDEDGKGIPGATVLPRFGGTSSRALKAVFEINAAITDEQGCFELTGIPDKAMASLGVSCQGYANVTSRDSHTITMQRGGSISGRVVDEHGRPVAGVSVWSPRSDLGALPPKPKTSDDGLYVLEGLPHGDCDVVAEAGAFMAARRDVVVQAGGDTRIADLICPADILVTGRLLDGQTGEPVAGGMAFAGMPDRENAMFHTHSSPSDVEGRYSLIALPGRAEIQGGGGGYDASVPENIAVEIPEGGLRDLDIKLKKADSARGQAADLEGRPVPEAIVQSFIGERYSEQVLTGEDGAFEVEIPETDECGGG